MLTQQIGVLIEGLFRGAWETGLDQLECEALLLEAGLVVMQPATEEDVAQHEGLELERGDEVMRLTAFAASCRRVAQIQREARAAKLRGRK